MRVPFLLAVLLASCGDPAPDAPWDAPAPNDARAANDTDSPSADVPSVDSSVDAGTRCVPDTVRACTCGVDEGAQRCLRDGLGFEACECPLAGLSLYVRPAATGGDGTRERPFATPTEARDALRARRAAGTLPDAPIVVWLGGGSYEGPLELSAEDSGTARAPITWRSVPGERARLRGGRALDPRCFVPVPTGAPIQARLHPAARDAIRVCDLASQGIEDTGALVYRHSSYVDPRAVSALELFIDGEPATLARWPNPDEDSPALDPLAASIDVHGTLEPDVAGHYVRVSEMDGVSAFRREGLVGGLQYYLRRHSVTDGYVGWFLTTTESGYPVSDPFWYLYQEELGILQRDEGTRALGLPFLGPLDRLHNGFALTAEPLTTGPGVYRDDAFHYGGDRPSRWSGEGVRVHGLFRFPWHDSHHAVTIDTATRTVTLDRATQFGIWPSQPYYFYNVLEELDQAGEYFVDARGGELYVFPRGDLSSAEVLVSTLEVPVITLRDAQHIAFRDLVIEGGRSQLVNIARGNDLRFVQVEFANGGVDGLVIDEATRVTIERAHIHGLGNAGVRIASGDRPSLRRADVLIENTEIHDVGRFVWMYQAGVVTSGVGTTVRQSHLHHMPHSAILWGGNEHLFELNTIEHVCHSSSDAGAIYAGRDWGARGNVIRNNVIRHIDTIVEGLGVHGVYLDDALSGVRVEGNIFYDISGHAVDHGGGRDDIVRFNVMARCGSAFRTDTRGAFLIRSPTDPASDASWRLWERLAALGYRSEPWASRYPECAAIPTTWEEISAPGARWRWPEDNIVSGNLGWQNGRFWEEYGGAGADFTATGPNVEDSDPRFVDEASDDLALRDDSPAYAIEGFPRIPYEDIGIAP